MDNNQDIPNSTTGKRQSRARRPPTPWPTRSPRPPLIRMGHIDTVQDREIDSFKRLMADEGKNVGQMARQWESRSSNRRSTIGTLPSRRSTVGTPSLLIRKSQLPVSASLALPTTSSYQTVSSNSQQSVGVSGRPSTPWPTQSRSRPVIRMGHIETVQDREIGSLKRTLSEQGMSTNKMVRQWESRSRPRKSLQPLRKPSVLTRSGQQSRTVSAPIRSSGQPSAMWKQSALSTGADISGRSPTSSWAIQPYRPPTPPSPLSTQSNRQLTRGTRAMARSRPRIRWDHIKTVQDRELESLLQLLANEGKNVGQMVNQWESRDAADSNSRLESLYPPNQRNRRLSSNSRRMVAAVTGMLIMLAIAFALVLRRENR